MINLFLVIVWCDFIEIDLVYSFDLMTETKGIMFVFFFIFFTSAQLFSNNTLVPLDIYCDDFGTGLSLGGVFIQIFYFETNSSSIETGLAVMSNASGRASVLVKQNERLFVIGEKRGSHPPLQSAIVETGTAGLTGVFSQIVLQMPDFTVTDLFRTLYQDLVRDPDNTCTIVTTVTRQNGTIFEFPHGEAGAQVELIPPAYSNRYYFGSWGDLSDFTNPFARGLEATSKDGGVLFFDVPVNASVVLKAQACAPFREFTETEFVCVTPGMTINGAPNQGPRVSMQKQNDQGCNCANVKHTVSATDPCLLCMLNATRVVCQAEMGDCVGDACCGSRCLAPTLQNPFEIVSCLEVPFGCELVSCLATVCKRECEAIGIVKPPFCLTSFPVTTVNGTCVEAPPTDESGDTVFASIVEFAWLVAFLLLLFGALYNTLPLLMQRSEKKRKLKLYKEKKRTGLNVKDIKIHPASSIDMLSVPLDWKESDGGNGGMERSRVLERLVVENLQVSSKEGKKLVSDASFEFKAGDMVALLGPSGCGKTTLMKAIASRDVKNKVQGRVFVNGKECSFEDMRKLTSFAACDVPLYPELSVEEFLYFNGKLRCAKETTTPELNDHVDNILTKLNLLQNAKGKVGGALSTGELKRAIIGSEFVVNSSFLLLDEPLSGLDARLARQVIDMIRAYADQGHIVFFSVHQPSKALFDKVDKVMFMSRFDERGGQIVYFGERDSCKPFFDSCGYVYPEEIMADACVEIITPIWEGNSAVAANAHSIKEVTDKWKEQYQSEREITESTSLSASFIRDDHISWWKECAVVFQMQALMLFSNWGMLVRRLVVSIALSLMIGLIFLNLQYTPDGIVNRSGASFFMISQIMVLVMISCGSTLPQARELAKVEMLNRTFHPFSLWNAVSALSFIVETVMAFFTGFAAYFMMNFVMEGERFGLFSITLILVGNSGASILFFVSCIFPTRNYQANYFVSGGTVLILLIFGGYFARSIPIWLDWIKYLSPYYYGFQLLIYNELRDTYYPCQTELCPSTNGEFFLRELGFGEINVTDNLAILVGFVVGFRALSYLVFWLSLLKYKGETQKCGCRSKKKTHSPNAPRVVEMDYSLSAGEMEIVQESNNDLHIVDL